MLAGGGTRSLEIFDPTKKEWTTVAGQLSTVRSFHAAALLQDGKVLIAGGRDGDVPLNSTDLFDPATGSVTPSGFLTVPRAGHTATTLLDGTVLIAGGDGLSSAEIYDPERQSFSPTASMSGARAGHAAILLPDNNNVLLAGGRDADGAALASAEIFSPAEGVFRPAAPIDRAVATPILHATETGVVTLLGLGENNGQTFRFPAVTAVLSKQPRGALEVDGEGWQPEEVVRLSVCYRGTSRPEVTVVADGAGKFHHLVPTDADTLDSCTFLSARGWKWRTIIHVHAPSDIFFLVTSCPQYYGSDAELQGIVTRDLGSSGPVPTGSVTLADSSVNLITETLVDGPGAINSPFSFDWVANAGPHSFVVTYSGDGNYLPSNTGTYTCSIYQANTNNTSLKSSANPAVYGQPLQITATFTWGVDTLGAPPPNFAGATPTGNVYLLEDQEAFIQSTFQNGTVVFSPLLSVGQYNFSAEYLADQNYMASGDGLGGQTTYPSVLQTINQAHSTVGISFTPNPAVYGQQVSVAYQVSAVSPSQAIPTGTCTVVVDGSSSSCALNASGQLNVVYADGLPAGNHGFSLTYPGTINIAGSTGIASLTVNKATPSVTVTSLANPSVAGQAVTFVAMVSLLPPALESVTFSDGNTLLETSTLNIGEAAFTTSALPAPIRSRQSTAAMKTSIPAPARSPKR